MLNFLETRLRIQKGNVIIPLSKEIGCYEDFERQNLGTAQGRGSDPGLHGGVYDLLYLAGKPDGGADSPAGDTG